MGDGDLTDAYHAYRVADLPNVEVAVLPDSGHSVAEALAGTEALSEIVDAAISGGRPFPLGFEPGIEDASLRRAIIEGVEGRYFGGDALGPLSKVLAARPTWTGAHQFLGQTQLAARRYDEAETSFRTVLLQQPEWYVPYRYLGEALMRQGRVPAAEAPLRRAVEMRPDWGWATAPWRSAYYVWGKQTKPRSTSPSRHASSPAPSCCGSA